MVAVDSSRPMLNLFKKRLSSAGRFTGITSMCRDLRWVNMERAGVVVVNVTLQFIPPEDKDALMPRWCAWASSIVGGLLWTPCFRFMG